MRWMRVILGKLVFRVASRRRSSHHRRPDAGKFMAEFKKTLEGWSGDIG